MWPRTGIRRVLCSAGRCETASQALATSGATQRASCARENDSTIATISSGSENEPPKKDTPSCSPSRAAAATTLVTFAAWAWAVRDEARGGGGAAFCTPARRSASISATVPADSGFLLLRRCDHSKSCCPSSEMVTFLFSSAALTSAALARRLTSDV